MGNCKTTVTGCVPEIDNTPLECEELVSAECVVTVDSYNFFGIGIGETLSSVLTKIVTKVKSLSNTINGFTSLVIDPLAPGVDCVAGGLEFKTVNAITGSLISTQYLCKEVYEGDDIICSATTLVTAGDTPSVALKSVSDHFCNRLKAADSCCEDNAAAIDVVSQYADTLVETVSGLNTDNTDPRNPIIQISVDGSTITGAGTPGDPLVASGGAFLPLAGGTLTGPLTMSEGQDLILGATDFIFNTQGFGEVLFGNSFLDVGKYGGNLRIATDTEFYLFSGFGNGALEKANITLANDSLNIEQNDTGGVTRRISMDGVQNGIYITDDRHSMGMHYKADYSSNYTNRSLVDKEYVDNKVTGYTGSYLNGSGQTVTVVDGLITSVV